ncbi:zinc-dependent metalloprotease [Terrimonas pollutisoli]|uniref:zinc-dependent metalloprotease n=1 Tax=Terrimonas pollutisoli TaxID=3034147 RepID=UPI0023EC565E|nr:zinc-dependent metalloprotease [Terrimonas sp. H1YJ31]
MHPFFSRLAVSFIAVTTCALAIAQPRTDTTKSSLGGGPRQPSSGPKAYKDVITAKAITDEGLFSVHKLDDKYFFEIGDTLLGRDILIVNRIAKAAAGMRNGFFGYAGDQIGQNVIRFEKGPNNKIFLRNVSFAEYSKDSTSPMFTAVNKSNVQPIAAAFDIKAFSKDSMGSVIDVTDYVNGDNDVLFFNSQLKTSMRIGSQQSDKSYIVGIRSFPLNIELSSVKTYSRMAGPPTGIGGGTPGGNLTIEMNSSFVLLPKEPMQPRHFDPRVGYFAVGYTDFDANPQGVETARLIKRWRLEPKDEDIEKYKKGELVEPKKPIVFYIDPATPKVWVPYLIQGINDWQASFEKAGFKNAIIGKIAPSKEEDPDWSLEDARYSAIVYKPSDVANASGPSVSDPRSGEIMESHINWYHNVMELIHHWYFVQCAPVDTAARKMIYDNELMGQLIRFVSSHEVGHTLGLRHNYGSSSSVPVEKLRDKAWVEKHGHTPSIMDYARFNYVAQPEDKISRAGLFPRIGDYDHWAIEWGYKLFPQFNDAEAEKTYLNKWVMEKLKDNRLWFGTETNPDDPRSQREQVGDDGMKGAMYGIKNLQRIVPNLEDWTKMPNKDYSNLRSMYNQVTNQFSMYLSHVAKYVGGIMETPKMVEEKGPVYEVVSKAKQREAVDFLNKQLFATPSWLINKDIFDKTGINAISTVGSLQDNVLNRLLATRSLSKLIDAEAEQGSAAYTITDLFSDLKKGIWTELPARSKIDVYRRNLQKSYVGILSDLINPPKSGSGSGIVIMVLGAGSTTNTEKSDIISVTRAHLAALRSEIKAALGGINDVMSRYHLQDLVTRIDNSLNPKP